MRLLLISLLLLLTGCSTLAGGGRTRYVTQTVPVRVPVYACPAPPLVMRPTLPIAHLRPGDDPARVARAYAASVALLMGYSARLEALLAAYADTTSYTPPSSTSN